MLSNCLGEKGKKEGKKERTPIPVTDHSQGVPFRSETHGQLARVGSTGSPESSCAFPFPPPLHHAPFTLGVSGLLSGGRTLHTILSPPTPHTVHFHIVWGRMGLWLSGSEGKGDEEDGKNYRESDRKAALKGF